MINGIPALLLVTQNESPSPVLISVNTSSRYFRGTLCNVEDLKKFINTSLLC